MHKNTHYVLTNSVWSNNILNSNQVKQCEVPICIKWKK